MRHQLYIKNMVCPRCITAVEHIFNTLNIAVENIVLGQVTLQNSLSKLEKDTLNGELITQGFELLEDQQTQLIGQIKSILIHHIHHQTKALKVNYSDLLTEQLHVEYSSLSKLFSSVEGITIERFVLKQKIEKVKELLFYDQFSLSEIAHQMHYSSVAHLSAQFKRETGMTPTGFKKDRKPGHQSLDSL